MKKILTIIGVLMVSVLLTKPVHAHCEVPCGIYDDQARVQQLFEHSGTVQKAMNKIKELSAEGDKNYNQIVRWVTNKEKHAEEIQEIVYQYFMTQRIKPYQEDQEKYVRELTLLHKIMVHAMKAKQTTDETHTEKINDLIRQFSDSYFSGKKGSDKGSHKGSAKGDHKGHDHKGHEGHNH